MSISVRIEKLKDLLNKALVFFNPGSANYWHTITPCNVSEMPRELGQYYLDFSSKCNYAQNFDSSGVPLFRYLNEIPQTYHPIAICQYALGLFHELDSNDYKDNNLRMKFITQAEWLVKNSSNKTGGEYWYFNYADRRYGIIPPWCSAMAQGEAISVLCRAFKITGDTKYLEKAKAALKPFFIPIAGGGVRNLFKDVAIFEEFPTSEITGVLNGFIFSIFGIYDYLLLEKHDTEISRLFEDAINNLKELLQYYDLGYWSRYDLFKYPLENPASFTYHSLHIEQLKALYVLTGEMMFNEYSLRFQDYSRNFNKKIKALIRKIIYLKKIKAI